MSLWRIASEAPAYRANDMSGQGAERSGGRWNPRGTPMVYASTTRALACLETMMHLAGTRVLPLNRYLVEVIVPTACWAARAKFPTAQQPTWDALPPGMASLTWGNAWIKSMRTLVAEVPSVVVPEERNVLINPRHADVSQIRTVVRRRWTYDGRV